MMDAASDSYWRMPSPGDSYSVASSSAGGTFDPMDHAHLSPSAFSPAGFSGNFSMPRFASSNSFLGGPGQQDSFREGSRSLEPLTFETPADFSYAYPNNNSAASGSSGESGANSGTNSGSGSASGSRAGTSPNTSNTSVSPAPQTTSAPYRASGPIYAPYGSSVVSVDQANPGPSRSAAPPSSRRPPTFDPVALGIPAPPETTHNFAGLYSSSGFDIISVLARLAARPNPTIQIGPVDLSCSFLVVDAKQYDMPIVFASETFTALTGYRNDEIVGRNCRFLQSPDGFTPRGEPRKYTDSHAAWHMRTHIMDAKESQSSLINYRKSGEAFINLVTIIPITWDKSDEIAYFVGLQVDLVDQPNAILGRMKDGSYTVNYSLLNHPPKSISMKSIESMEPGESWTSSATSVVPAVQDEKVIVAAPVAMDTDDMDEKSLLDILVKEGLGGLEGEGERKQFNKLLLDNSNDFIHVLSLKGSILYCSPSSSKILEYEPSELVGTLIQGLCHPSDVVPVVRELKDSGAVAHSKVNLLYRIQRKHSGYIWIEAAGKLHIEPGKGRKCVILTGRPRQVFKLSWDDLRQEGGLAETEFWTKVNKEGKVLTATRGVHNVLGRLPSDMVGTSLFDFAGPGEMGDVVRQVLAGEGVSVQSRMKGQNGFVDVVTRFYPRQVRIGNGNDFQMDHEIGAPPHVGIIAQTTELASHNRKHQLAAFSSPPNYIASKGSAAPEVSPAAPSAASSDAENAPPPPPAFVSTFKTLKHQSEESDNVFDELDTTRCTSWQYELHQLQILNKRLRDEKDYLVDQSRKRPSVQGRGRVGSGDSAGREVKLEDGVGPVASSSGSALRWDKAQNSAAPSPAADGSNSTSGFSPYQADWSNQDPAW